MPIFPSKIQKALAAAFICLASALLAGCGSTHDQKQLFAMDTYMTIDAYGSKKAVESALAESEDVILSLDRLWSIGNPDSEISRLNETGFLLLSKDTEDLLANAIAVSETTGGALDLTVLPLMECWGFTTQDYRVPSPAEIDALLPSVGMEHLFLHDHTLTLSPGTRIDLGAAAKGYASDRVRDILVSCGITSANINLGGNVCVIGSKEDGSPWRIGLENPRPDMPPFSSASYLGILSVKDTAVITSGDYHRYFEKDGVRYHHIMDPATGRPADTGLLSVTIVSPSGILSDALSTALFVLGKEKALRYWENHSSDFEMILAEADGTITVTEGLSDIFTSDLPYSLYSPKSANN